MNTPSVTTSMRVLRRDFRAEAHAQADGLADCARRSVAAMRAAAARAAIRRGSSTQDLSVGPGLVEQHQRHARGLAGAGRRHQHGGVVRAQRRGQFRQRGVDRQRGIEAHAFCHPGRAHSARAGTHVTTRGSGSTLAGRPG